MAKSKPDRILGAVARPATAAGAVPAQVAPLSRPRPPAMGAAPAADSGLAAIIGLALDSVSSPQTRRAYGLALTRFLAWYQAEGAPGLTRATVQRYRALLETAGLSASTLNVRLSAIRKLALEAAENGLLAPELASGIARIRGAKRRGVRAGNWLTPQEATALVNAPSRATLTGLRDRALLALLVGCGLRRAELAALAVEAVQMRDSRWALPDLEGKGGRVRTVPVPAWVKMLLDEWLQAARIDSGPIFRRIRKGGSLQETRLSEDAVWYVVRRHAARIGKPKLAPHDLRRTCAKLCRLSGGELEQIQFLLGHASIQTTERYLGARQNLAQAVNDQLPITPDL